MAKPPLTNDSEFVVGEEKILNYILAVLCLAIFMYGLIDAARRRFVNIDYQSFVFALALWPAIYCIRRARSNRIYIRINKKGIYHEGKLVTPWRNFLNAYLAQDENKKIYDIQDRFILVVEYRKDGLIRGQRKKIPLGNTQNKSEEDVLAAVRFFSNLYRKFAGS